MQHTVFVHFSAVVLNDYNVKLPETSELPVLWRKCRTCQLFTFFFTAAHFHLALVAASISHFLTASTIFSCCSSNKKIMSPLFFISRSRSLSVFFQVSFAGLPPTFSCSINLSLILQKTRIQKQFPLSVFVFIDSLVVSALQDAGGYAISHQNKLQLHLGCHTC